jgi:hypothetical protein
MVLNINSLFGAGAGKINSNENKENTIIVATDGSGDTDSIIEAEKMLPPTGGSIYIKEGTYISPSITISKPNVVLYGAGLSTVIVTTGDTPGIYVVGKDTTLRDFKIYGTGAGNTENVGISLGMTDNSKIYRVNVDNCGGVGIGLRMCTNCIINGCIISNCRVGVGIYGVGITLDGLPGGPSYNIVVSNNVIFNSSIDGININGGNTTQSNYHIIIGNRIYDCTTTQIRILSAHCHYNLLSSNMLRTSVGAGITDLGTNTTLVGNVV